MASRRSVFSSAQYLASRARFGVKFGLEVMHRLLDALDHPERSAPVLLVAGTNGKGSVVAYADAALRASGLRVGRYISPHLVRVNERIVVDGEEIADRRLDRALLQVRDRADALVRRGVLRAQPTHFEVLTLAALLEFRARGVDVVLLEVGLGGRLDATNAVDPAASAIVSVDFDHERYLGRTLPAIAREKAGVLRPGCVTVLGPLKRAADAAVAREAERIGARLARIRDTRVEHARDGSLAIETPHALYRGVRPLLGRHQEANVVVALRLLEEAGDAGIRFDPTRAVEGINRTRWPGRLQWLPTHPPVLLDGAHNPAGARALARYLRGRGPFVLVFGVMADKAVEALARALFPLATRVILTRPNMRRAASPRTIRRRAGPVAHGSIVEPNVGRAMRRARAVAGSDGFIVVSGSLFLVGEVLRRIGREVASGRYRTNSTSGARRAR